MLVKVLRIGSLPSDLSPGVGLAAFYLSSDRRVATTHISFKNNDSELFAPSCESFILLPFPNFAISKKSFFTRFFLLLIRLVNLSIFSFLALWKTYNSKFDIVHVHSPFFIPLSFFYRMRGSKLAFTVHGADFYKYMGSSFWLGVFRFFDVIFCMTDEQADYFRSTLNNKMIVYVGNGVDFDFFHECKVPKIKKIIAVGTLRWQKGFPFLLSSFQRSKAFELGWSLEIVGDGPDKSSLESLVGELGLAQHVSFLGSLSRAQLSMRFSRASIFILSSETEAFPKVLLEAMSAGCDVIATNVGQAASVLRGCGKVVEFGDVQSLSAAIRSRCLVSQLESNFDLVEIARSHSWEAYVDTNIDAYFNLFRRDS